MFIRDLIKSNYGRENSYINNQTEFKRLDSCTHGGLYSTDNNQEIRIDFSSNINPLGISRKVLSTISQNIRNVSITYPDPKCRELRRRISKYLDYNILPECITVGNGATELIHQFVRSFPYRALIPIPTFCEYELAVRRMGLKIDFVDPFENFQIDNDLLIKKLKKRSNSILFLCNPNNPTGRLTPVEIIKKIMEEAKDKSTLVLIDESFIEFVKNYERNSMISYVMEYNNLIILRSMTKSFGLAGLRLGYLVANPNLITKINLNQIAWNVNGVAQIAGIEALNDQDHLVRAKKLIEKEKIRILKAIREKMKGLVSYNSEANFLLIKLKNKDSTWYKEELLKNYGILVRDCSSFRGMSNEFIRIAVRTPNENEFLLTALENMEANINN